MWTEGGQDPFADKTANNKAVLPSLASTMGVAFMVNERGNIWIVHNKPLPVILNWVEFDVDLSSITLISQDGQVIDLGMKVQKALQKPMMQAREIYIVYMVQEEVKDLYILPLTLCGLK
jgi:hypothetical protein